MSARLASGLIVSGLLRQVANAGGFAAVLAKGDADSGAILMVLAQKGEISGIYERVMSQGGAYRWLPSSADFENADAIFTRRRERDPDLWIIELDIADGEQFVAALNAIA